MVPKHCMDDDSPPALFTTQDDSEPFNEDRDPVEEYANGEDYNNSGTDRTQDGCLDQGCPWWKDVPLDGAGDGGADVDEMANKSTGRKLELKCKRKYELAKY
jgi:hypothetical protein